MCPVNSCNCKYGVCEPQELCTSKKHCEEMFPSKCEVIFQVVHSSLTQVKGRSCRCIRSTGECQKADGGDEGSGDGGDGDGGDGGDDGATTMSPYSS